MLQARGDSTDAREALSSICAAYYGPVLAYLKGALRDSAAVQDVAHDFFASLLVGDPLSNVCREKGRFRAYVIGALKHFLLKRFAYQRRQRRGGDATLIPLDVEADATHDRIADASQCSPEAAFDRAWALTILSRSLAVLRKECEAEGRLERFEMLKPWLMGDPEFGAQAEIARTLEIEPNALKAAVHRLKGRFRRLVKAEIAATLCRASDLDEEMRALFRALRGP